MRRRTALPFMLILGLVAALGTAPGLVVAQEDQQDLQSVFGEDITVTRLEGLAARGERVQAYAVTFEETAFIPEREYPEAMVVKVQSGTFAFRAQSDVLIDPQGMDIRILEANPSIPVGSPPNPNQRYDDTGETVANCSGTSPTVLCLINPTLLQDRYVQLEEGYTVYLPDNTTCFFCNTTGLQGGDTTASPVPGGDTSPGGTPELLVWAPSDDFSWYNLDQGTPTAEGTPSAQEQTAARGWRLNPGSPCH